MVAKLCFVSAIGITIMLLVSAKELRKLDDQLVTMTPKELFTIISCVAKFNIPSIHKQFEACESKMPAQVVEALKKCQEEVIPADQLKCSYYSVIFEKPDLVPKVYECVRESTEKFKEEEKKMMVEFEICARKLFIETCPLPKPFIH